MISLDERINVLSGFGAILQDKVQKDENDFEALCQKAFQKNGWFTPENIKHAANVWALTLSAENIHEWLSSYTLSEGKPKTVGVINAGNIPFTGMHDLLTVFITGNKYIAKNSSEDPYLMPYIVDLLIRGEPQLDGVFQFTDKLPLSKEFSNKVDAIIATGSNNSAHHFEYYFRNVPHIIRRNRNAIALLSGDETFEELNCLGEDIFRYFGLGCRSVSKMYVPGNYDFNNFFEAIFSFSPIMQHNKYMNNFDYNNTIRLMNSIPFLQNGFLIVQEEKQIPSPIAVLHYERYGNLNELTKTLDACESQIQCVVTNKPLEFKTELKNRTLAFGQGQLPALSDYSDGVDTMKFLLSL